MSIRVEIEGMPFTLLRDVDKANLAKLGFPGKIDWLEARVDLILINPLRAALKNWEEGQLGLVLVTGLCAGISAASTFLKGRRPDKTQNETDRQLFLDFVNTYMSPHERALKSVPMGTQWVGAVPATWAEWLYTYVRNGLAHAFAVEQGAFHMNLPALIDEANPTEPVIDAARLLDAFESAWATYLKDVRTDGEQSALGQNFSNRWNAVFLGTP